MNVKPTVTKGIEIRLLLEAIYQQYHHDFRRYAMASLERRIGAALLEFDCRSISGLQEKVLHDPNMFNRLLQILTIQVSDMFRAPFFFRTFREEVVPELKTYPSLKLWIAGCSSGEELYSVAIILHEEGLLKRAIIYATDINPSALAKAKAGIYALNRMRAFSENYQAAGGKASLVQYYTAAYGAALFHSSLRAGVVFSDHSLATDNVFAGVHAVFCRNVLIYFDRELQAHATRLFSNALCRRGFLGLGERETLQFSPMRDAFEEVLPDSRWYRRR